MVTDTTYRITAAPKFAEASAWDCAECGRQELGKPVFLDGGAGVIAVGTGCAAKLLGFPRSKAAHVRKLADVAEAAAVAEAARQAEIAANKAAALDAFTAGDDENAYLIAARQDFHRLGGSAVLGSFSGWLAAVAATGELVPAA